MGKHAVSSSAEETHTLLYGLIAQWRACLQLHGPQSDSSHASPAADRLPSYPERPGHQRNGSNMSSSSSSMLLQQHAAGEAPAPGEVDVLMEPFIEVSSVA